MPDGESIGAADGSAEEALARAEADVAGVGADPVVHDAIRPMPHTHSPIRRSWLATQNPRIPVSRYARGPQTPPRHVRFLDSHPTGAHLLARSTDRGGSRCESRRSVYLGWSSASPD